ncbi:uncharacterized protein LOC142174657 [Nicotiana tabacum]|uniref:Uncharacterized protein LOC142174657 n=1 Tax=Nicotiana tabacum TaxID=4097 RepID=A0AC58THB1_TOBAC
MKAWTPDFNLHDEVLRTIPLWVKFPNLPLNCWSMKALSKIGSALGNPVYADDFTTSTVIISYARMLIEMDITKPLPRRVKMQDPMGNKIEQEIRIEQATNEPGTSSMQLRSYGAQEMYQDTQFIPWISNFSNNNKSRTWVLWDLKIFDFEPTDIDDQIIHGQVRTHSRLLAFGFTSIYGLHTIKDRLSMWQKLRQINSLQQGPWLAMGDFNAVLNSQDRQHSTIIQDMETKDFREFMSDTGMNELPSIGWDYTWTNNHTYSRIDRGLVNIDWMMTMPSLSIQILEPSFSDHSPLKLMISQIHRKKASPFRFFNCIAEHPQFIQEVDQAWSTTGKMGSYMEYGIN